ncbi:hypothetical protein SLEP1_g15065 [Rubroshorea leprosula]|uniref:Uncharacterized protein n=1 Tax=Rubroshorea leprosula TaxID=152421 RepID=A0AAV5ISA2_9ROSI|nr:hypothetical protein SLEP1_g15065 [Rubroshorea leprosula]
MTILYVDSMYSKRGVNWNSKNFSLFATTKPKIKRDAKLELQDCQESWLNFLEPTLYSWLTTFVAGFAGFCRFCFLHRAGSKTQSQLCRFPAHFVFFHIRLQSLEPTLPAAKLEPALRLFSMRAKQRTFKSLLVEPALCTSISPEPAAAFKSWLSAHTQAFLVHF